MKQKVILLAGLIGANVFLHTLFIGSGLFNTFTPSNYTVSFATGMILYLVVVSFLAGVVAFLRKFSFNGFQRRFLSYGILIQTFLAIVHLYLIFRHSAI